MSQKINIETLARRAKEAAFVLANVTTLKKNQVLLTLAQILEEKRHDILAANREDEQNAREKKLSAAAIDRLALDDKKIDAMIAGVRDVALLPDPVGAMGDFHNQPSGIMVGKMRVPLGVIGMIYESRPNVTVDAFALCFKAGNAVILRGGSEAFLSNQTLAECIREALCREELSPDLLGFVGDTDRDLVGDMLGAVGLIDVLIPRGGKSLVARVAEDAKIPVIKHLEGICHIYADAQLNLKSALEIIVNAKTSRYGTCNTLETLLVHAEAAASLLPPLAKRLTEKGVELRGCDKTRAILPDIVPATDEDWTTEYLAPILAIKIVPDLAAAVHHINHYGSHHTDTILTENYTDAWRFLRAVDSASVIVNASTRFADGFEYGLGAEIGISTDKLHARGPVGLLGLTTEKWVVLGSGQIRS